MALECEYIISGLRALSVSKHGHICGRTQAKQHTFATTVSSCLRLFTSDIFKYTARGSPGWTYNCVPPAHWKPPTGEKPLILLVSGCQSHIHLTLPGLIHEPPQSRDFPSSESWVSSVAVTNLTAGQKKTLPSPANRNKENLRA